MKKLCILLVLFFTMFNNPTFSQTIKKDFYIGLGLGEINQKFAFGLNFGISYFGFSIYSHNFHKEPKYDLDEPAHSDYSEPQKYELTSTDLNFRFHPIGFYNIYPFIHLGAYNHGSVSIAHSNVTDLTAKTGKEIYWDFIYGFGLQFKVSHKIYIGMAWSTNKAYCLEINFSLLEN